MASYPIYLLELGEEIRAVFPEDKQDIGHADFWEQTASLLVAEHYKVPQRELANMPYCQRRGRIVGSTFYCGEKDGPEVLRLVRQAVGMVDLVLCFDDHEKRLREDVRTFRRLVKRGDRKARTPP
jgi:hypothetical protein